MRSNTQSLIKFNDELNDFYKLRGSRRSSVSFTIGNFVNYIALVFENDFDPTVLQDKINNKSLGWDDDALSTKTVTMKGSLIYFSRHYDLEWLFEILWEYVQVGDVFVASISADELPSLYLCAISPSSSVYEEERLYLDYCIVCTVDASDHDYSDDFISLFDAKFVIPDSRYLEFSLDTNDVSRVAHFFSKMLDEEEKGAPQPLHVQLGHKRPELLQVIEDNLQGFAGRYYASK